MATPSSDTDALADALDLLGQALRMRRAYLHVQEQFERGSDAHAIAGELHARADTRVDQALRKAVDAGASIAGLARVVGVSTRTIRRRLQRPAGPARNSPTP